MTLDNGDDVDGKEDGGGGGGGGAWRVVRVAVFRPLTLQWQDPRKRKKKSKKLVLGECDSRLSKGHQTPAFWAQAAHRGQDNLPSAELCFSLVSQAPNHRHTTPRFSATDALLAVTSGGFLPPTVPTAPFFLPAFF